MYTAIEAFRNGSFYKNIASKYKLLVFNCLSLLLPCLQCTFVLILVPKKKCTVYWRFLLSLALVMLAFTKSPVLPKLFLLSSGYAKILFKEKTEKRYLL